MNEELTVKEVSFVDAQLQQIIWNVHNIVIYNIAKETDTQSHRESWLCMFT